MFCLDVSVQTADSGELFSTQSAVGDSRVDLDVVPQ